MATIDDFGDVGQPLDNPALGGPTGWAAAVRDHITGLPAAIAAKVSKAGDTMTGPLILAGAPTVANGAATKGYVDGAPIVWTIASAGWAHTDSCWLVKHGNMVTANLSIVNAAGLTWNGFSILIGTLPVGYRPISPNIGWAVSVQAGAPTSYNETTRVFAYTNGEVRILGIPSGAAPAGVQMSGVATWVAA